MSSARVEGGGGSTTVAVPEGDPAALRQGAALLRRIAAGICEGVEDVGVAANGVVARAGWTGDAQEAFSRRAARLVGRVAEVEPPLVVIARAVEFYADALAAAQARATAAAGTAALASLLTPRAAPAALAGAQQDAAAAGTAALAAASAAASAVVAATAGLPDRRDAPPEPLDAEPAERDRVSWYELADSVNGWGGYGISPVATALGLRELQVVAQAWLSLRGGPQHAVEEMWNDGLGELAGRLERGELSTADIPVVLRRLGAREDAVRAFWRHIPGFDRLARGGVPDKGVPGTAGRLFGAFGLVSDGLTLWNPGTDNPAERVANRAAAAANGAGTLAVLAPGAVDGAAGVLGLDAAVGWVPVAGQVVVALTGLYLSGDWAYHHLTWFRNAANAAGHALEAGSEETKAAVCTAARDTEHVVTAAEHQAGHEVSDLGSDDEHAARRLVHDMNPLSWG